MTTAIASTPCREMENTMTQTMKALIGTAGPKWELAEVPRPAAGPGEILVHVQAAATNEVDRLQLRDDGTAGQVAGYEFVGRVAALGEGVTAWQTEDAVMGTAPRAFAEYVVVDAGHVIAVPAGLDPAIAAAVPVGLSAELGALRKAGFAAGDTVLITGASTGIGLLGAQLAKALGAAAVLGTTRSPGKRDLLAAAGVDTVIVTGQDDLAETVLAATGGEGVDLVLDHVAGQTFADCLPLTRRDGRVVNIGRLDGPAATIDIDALSYRNLTVYGVSFSASRPDELGTILAALEEEAVPAVLDGRIRPVIDRTADWEEHAVAAARLVSCDARGKLVLAIDA
ncbi:quinone oxidoreductase family protein [Brachybacterium hainanense]|uniref:Zinc-binding alcohol dehydrogenase family protein n=1 Tax=Brachybacterium hainanense TaxID=1541174 RepID=A0ABV6RF52_9MICO